MKMQPIFYIKTVSWIPGLQIYVQSLFYISGKPLPFSLKSRDYTFSPEQPTDPLL